ncbi:MAG: ASKHA domain-containing protein [Desulforhopalus sp.]
MPKVFFVQSQQEAKVPLGSTILEAVRKAGMAIDSPCNQTGVCGKCRVLLSPQSLSNIKNPEQSVLPPELQTIGWALACHTAIHGDIEIVEIPDAKRDSGAVLQHGHRSDLAHAPLLFKQFIEKNDSTLIFAGQECIGEETGDTSPKLFGVAVDIGTTTLVTSLIDLLSGEELASVSEHNPQSRYAQDVLSRISFAKTGEGLQNMQHTLMATLNTMLTQLTDQAGIEAKSIYELVFSGNTCMLHLATGTDPTSLGRYPYTPLITGNLHLDAGDLGLQVSPFARVYMPPILSSFVGADITSGILSLQLHKQSGISLFVDIGTNGEIVLAENGKMTATSTAAGPALEGMNISCGMCAGPGAVESVTSNPGNPNGGISFRTIADKPARGLCGSGLIDLIATLIDLGVIESNGRFASPDALAPNLAKHLVQSNGKMAFALTPEVLLSQKDIRQVQLAKGAIQAGIDFLMTHTGVGTAQVDRVLIAGAFGYHLATDSLLTLKILPSAFADKIDYVGNTSKTGGHTFLTNALCREEMAAVSREINILELSNQPDFERLFVRCLSF